MKTTDLAWNDLQLGMAFTSPSRTITEADVTIFASMTGDFAEIHVSEPIAVLQDFGGRIAHGLLVLSYSHGLMMGGGLFRSSVVAFLGIADWRFAAPVRLNDTIIVEFSIAELRVSHSLSNRGILGLDIRVVNQRGETVQSGRQSLLMRTIEDGH